MENLDSKPVRPGLKRKTLVFGILLLGLGFFWLLHNFGALDYRIWDAIISWQMLIIAIGVINVSNGNSRGFGAVLILVGTFFLVSDLYDLPFTFRRAFWPSLLILIGLMVLFGSHRIFRKRHITLNEGEDFIEEIYVFGGKDRIVQSKGFKGGKIISIFGGSKIDLTHAELLPGGHEIELVCIFGGSSMIVPSNWNVKVEIFSIFGGFEDKRRLTQVDYDKTLLVKGVAIFGGGDIKSI